MAALVSSFPSQSSTMLSQSRPSSSSGILQPSSQTQTQPQYSPNTSHGFAMSSSTYRAPMAPYAFTTTPALNACSSLQRPQAAIRTSSAPQAPAYQQAEKAAAGKRCRYPAPASISTASSSSSSELSIVGQLGVTRDDTALVSTARIATRSETPVSTILTSAPSLAVPNISPAKPSPDRYRRPVVRRADASGSSANGQTATIQSSSGGQSLNHVYGHAAPASPPNHQQTPQNSGSPNSTKPNDHDLVSVDDMSLNKQVKEDLAAKRYRRRSIQTVDSGDYFNLQANLSKQAFQQCHTQGPVFVKNDQHPLRSSPVNYIRPGSSHGRTGSSDSFVSSRSNHSRSNSRPDSVGPI